jgi:spore maturation protein CgeB
MRIALIYNKETEATTACYIERVMKKLGMDYVHFWTKDSSNIPQEFDLYFRIDHGDYKYDIPDSLRPAVFYAIDTHLEKPYRKIKKQAGHYDIIFCVHRDGARRLRKEIKADTQWIPVACDPEIHRKLDLPKTYDIGFIGREGKKSTRERRLRILKEKYLNSFIGTLDFKKMSEVYSASKIGFNSSLRNDINMRVFEIMASGCFLLTDCIKDNGFDDLFEAGKHLVTYRDDRELLQLADYYLKNEEEREKIAKQGYEWVVQNHTYFHRVQAMFNYIAFKFGGKFNDLRI